jgi:choline-glycine betaine transporter
VQFVAAFLIGLGLLFFGAGEWVNHPRQTQVKGAKVVGIYKVTGNPGSRKCTEY